jgi:alpha-amylase
MKSICLCIKIHIPVIYNKLSFSARKFVPHFYNSNKTKDHVNILADKRLLPLLNAISNLSVQFGLQFKIAISISGISLSLLEKFKPDVIAELKRLAQSDCIEFLAEPWSNSVLPYFNQNELTFQTELHRKTIHSLFGKTPEIFAAHTPVNKEFSSDFIPFPGCRTVFGYSNGNAGKNNKLSKKIPNRRQITKFLINHQFSYKMQRNSSGSCPESAAKAISSFIRYSRKHASLVKPLILFFNPLSEYSLNFRKWETMVSLLLEKSGGSFYSPTDLAEIGQYFFIQDDYSEEMLAQFIHPNYWIKSNMQKEAFEQFQNTWKFLHTNEYLVSTGAINFLQDLNNFLYMSDSFYSKEFTRRNFTPFNSPHEAFTHYMNAAGWILHFQKNNSKPAIENRDGLPDKGHIQLNRNLI